MDKIKHIQDFQTSRRQKLIINLESKAFVSDVFETLKNILCFSFLKKSANDEPVVEAK
jgi:hypothetical protein